MESSTISNHQVPQRHMSSAISPITPSPFSALSNHSSSRSRFSGTSTPELTEQQLKRYEETILKSFPELQGKKYGQSIDMKGGYRLLFPDMRNHINQIINRIPAEKVVEYKQRGLLGVSEEAADASKEVRERFVVASGLIDEKEARQFAETLKDCRAKGCSFAEFLQRIRNQLPQEKIEKFQAKADMPADQAEKLLTMIAAKYGFYQAEYPNFNIEEHSKPLLMGEIAELFEERERMTPSDIAILALGRLYTMFPQMPASLFDRVMGKYVQRRINLPVENQDLTHLVMDKTLNREYIHYNNPSNGDFKKAYDWRKSQYKAFEVLTEANVLYQAERRAARKKMELVG
jgi:hypothetical protein